MALSERLALIITGDASGAVREFQKVGNSAEKELGKAHKNIDKIGGRLQVGGAAAVGFAAVAGGALFSFAKQAEEARLSGEKLDNTLRNQPQLANANKKAFTDLASAIQKKTVADDDAVVSSQALLGQFGLTEDQILKITPLVVDLSRKMGIDLDAAAKAVGKTVDGNAGALKRMGVTVDETAFKADAFGATMEALQTSVGGFAEQEGKTFSGQLQILKNQLGEVQEGIGVGVVEAVSTAIGPITTLSEKFGELDPNVQKTIGSVGTFAVAGIGAAGALSVVAGSILKARDNFGRLATEFPRTTRGLGLVAKFAGAVGIAFAGWQLLDAIGALKTAGGTAEDAARSLDRLARSGKATGTAAEAFGEDYEDFASAIEAAGDKSLYDKIEQGAQRFNQVMDKLGGPLVDGGHKTLDMAQAVDKLDKQMAELVNQGSADKAVKIFDLLKEKAEEQDVPLGTLKKAFNDYESALKDATTAGETGAKAQGTLADAIDPTTDEIEDQADAAKKAEDNLRAWTDALYESRDANRAVDEAALSLTESIEDYTEKAKAASDEGFKNAEANRDWQRAANDVKDDIDEVARAAKNQADQNAALFGTTLSAAQSADVQREALIKLREEIRPGNPFRSYLDSLIADLDKAAQNRSGTTSLTVLVNGQPVFGGVNTFNNSQRRASGGPVRGGTPYLVGENGPELFLPSGPGQIVPNHRIRGGASSAVGGVVNFYVAVNNPAGNGDEIADKFVGSLKSGRNAAELRRVLAGV